MVFKLEEKIQNLEEGSCMDAIVFPLHGSLPPELQAISSNLIIVLVDLAIFYNGFLIACLAAKYHYCCFSISYLHFHWLLCWVCLHQHVGC